MTHHLLVRSYPGQPHVSLWLIRREGPTLSGLMWGEVLPKVADEIAAATGLPVEREECPLPGVKSQTPPGCLPVAKQPSLFPDAKE